MASDGPSDSRSRRPQRSLSHNKGKSHTHSHSHDSLPHRYLNRNPTVQEWGPTGRASSPAADPAELRNQNLRAALLANSSPVAHDLGKRKSSVSSSPGLTAPRGFNVDEDVLAYVHKVQPTDTLARVLLLFDIEPGALRKANRLWPNDNIQMRSQLYLPVDNCAVKSTPLAGNGTSNYIIKPKDDPPSAEPLFQLHEGHADPSWGSRQTLQASEDHHSFVHIDSVGPVEIVRMPRPKLSHFPPATTEQLPPPEPVVYQAVNLPEGNLGNIVGDVAKESLEGLEVVGAAIETFVRKFAANARTNWVNKTTGDLIELTSHLGGRTSSADERTSVRSKPPGRERAPRAENTLHPSASGSSLSSRGDRVENSKTRRRPTKQVESEG